MQDWMESKGFTPLYFFVARYFFVAITEKDRFDEPASCFRLDEKADLSIDHPFPKLVLGLVVCRFNPLSQQSS